MKKISKTVKGWSKEGYDTAKNNAERQINAWNTVIENYEDRGFMLNSTEFALNRVRPEFYVPESVFEIDMQPEHVAVLKCDAIMSYLKNKTKYGEILSENTTQYLIIAYRNKVIKHPYKTEEALPALVTSVSIYDDDVTLEYLLERFVDENQSDFYYIENGEKHYCSSVIDVIPLDGRTTTSYQISECDMENVIQTIHTRLDCIYNLVNAAQSTREQIEVLKHHKTKKTEDKKVKKVKTVSDVIDGQFSPKTNAELNALAKSIINAVFGEGSLEYSVNSNKGHEHKKKKKNNKKNEKTSDSDTRQTDTEELKPINTKSCTDENKNMNKEN